MKEKDSLNRKPTMWWNVIKISAAINMKLCTPRQLQIIIMLIIVKVIRTISEYLVTVKNHRLIPKTILICWWCRMISRRNIRMQIWTRRWMLWIKMKWEGLREKEVRSLREVLRNLRRSIWRGRTIGLWSLKTILRFIWAQWVTRNRSYRSKKIRKVRWIARIDREMVSSISHRWNRRILIVKTIRLHRWIR